MSFEKEEMIEGVVYLLRSTRGDNCFVVAVREGPYIFIEQTIGKVEKRRAERLEYNLVSHLYDIVEPAEVTEPYYFRYLARHKNSDTTVAKFVNFTDARFFTKALRGTNEIEIYEISVITGKQERVW